MGTFEIKKRANTVKSKLTYIAVLVFLVGMSVCVNSLESQENSDSEVSNQIKLLQKKLSDIKLRVSWLPYIM